MISWALSAAFLSGLAWSGLDIARKSLARNLAPAVIATGLSVGLTVFFGGWALFSSPELPPASYLRPAAISIVLAVAIHVLIIESVRRSELSRTIPLLSFTPVATALSGAAVLDEQPSTLQWAGIALVLVGALALGLMRREGGPLPGSRRLFGIDLGAALMLAAALCISTAAPFDKLAVAASSTPVHGFLQSLFSALLLIGYLAVQGDLRSASRALAQRPALTFAAVLAFAAIGFQFTAYQGVMVGVVETIKRVVGLASSLAAGYLVFGERITIKKIATVSLLGIGVTLMLL